MQIIVIGSGAGFPTGNKRSSCFWLETDENAILLDCGDGCAGGIQACNLEPLKIDAIAITHLHSDHWGGLGLFIQLQHLISRKKSLTIIMPREGIKVAQELLDVSYMWNERIGFEINWQPWESGVPVKLGNITITPYKNSHLSAYKKDAFRHPRSLLESFSFIVECENKVGIYSGDIGSLSDLDGIMPKKLAWLIIEGMHYSPEEFASWLPKHSIDKVIVTHIPPNRDEKDFPESAIIARDGMRIKL